MRSRTVLVSILGVTLFGLGSALNATTDRDRRDAAEVTTRPLLRDEPNTGGLCDPAPGTLPEHVEPVPDVRGITLCRAMRRVQARGWAVILTERRVHDPGLPPVGIVARQYPSPGRHDVRAGAVTLEALRPPIDRRASVGRECRPENRDLMQAAQLPTGAVNENVLPRWVPVPDAHGTHAFVGCVPREFVYPEIDAGQSLRDVAGGDDRPGVPEPVFSADGVLIGYLINVAGYQPMSVIRQLGLVAPDVIARTPTYDEYNTRG